MERLSFYWGCSLLILGSITAKGYNSQNSSKSILLIIAWRTSLLFLLNTFTYTHGLWCSFCYDHMFFVRRSTWFIYPYSSGYVTLQQLTTIIKPIYSLNARCTLWTRQAIWQIIHKICPWRFRIGNPLMTSCCPLNSRKSRTEDVNRNQEWKYRSMFKFHFPFTRLYLYYKYIWYTCLKSRMSVSCISYDDQNQYDLKNSLSKHLQHGNNGAMLSCLDIRNNCSNISGSDDTLVWNNYTRPPGEFQRKKGF